mmetsp:Transcript_67379/g.78183  ORF Transcript_67379/g.78183 Transcript_67379/m.78183 type:complete len:372 (+) Transcript_67379:23-1138(+)
MQSSQKALLTSGIGMLNKITSLKGHVLVQNTEMKLQAGATTDNGTAKMKTLLLDLDETLLHASDKPFSSTLAPNFRIAHLKIPPDVYTFYYIKRPFLKEFLEEVSKYYMIFIYTASDQRYAKMLLNAAGISPYITRLFHRDHCHQVTESIQVKNIFRLGFDPQDTVFIDDYEIQTKHAPVNSILIKKFKGDPKDRELEGLIGFLRDLASESDVRPVGRKLFEYHELANKVVSSGSLAVIDDIEDCNRNDDTKEQDENASSITIKNFTGNVSEIKLSISRRTSSIRALTTQAIDSTAMLRMRLPSPNLQTHNTSTDIVMPKTISKKPQRFESEGNLPSFIGKSPLLEKLVKRKEDLEEMGEFNISDDELPVD